MLRLMRASIFRNRLRSFFSQAPCLALLLGSAHGFAAVAPSATANANFDDYAAKIENRLIQARQSGLESLNAAEDSRLRRGELLVDNLASTDNGIDASAMLHHWRGRAFVPGATADGFQRIMRDFEAYPNYFSPEIRTARVLARNGDRYTVSMRVEQKHVVTVVMDTAYDVTFDRISEREGLSVSRSSRIEEIDAPGSAREHVLDAGHEHGFLWRQNTYWSYQERDGGLYLAVESLSLSRSIPTGLHWAVGPFVDSVPRESLEFTLHAMSAVLRPAAATIRAKQ